jgi:hypothetical protein
MSVMELIQAVKEGDIVKTKELLDEGEVDVNDHGDEQEWTPLNYASGKGDINMVNLLLERGADVFITGRDQRTPYEISLAAGHVEVAQLLRDTEEKVDPKRAKSSSKRAPKYCKAYYLRDLRQFSDWSESKINWKKNGSTGTDEATDESITFMDDQVVFLHTDFTVTESMWCNENVIFNEVTDDWKNFCSETLKFKIPDNFDLVA